jgi:LacI family repressor for deo operon, udp, cdd, tsx, nupC, and nupG
MSVTIYEIAERAGVSSSTVSRVLRSDGTEQRRSSVARAADIRRIAVELGYRPNVRARGFSQRRTYAIGMLYTDDKWVFQGMNALVVNSLVRTLQQSGYHLVFVPIDDGGAWEEIVLGGQIDGAVIFHKMPEQVGSALRERKLPTILLGDNSDSTLSQIIVDDYSGAYAATKHLIGLGHKRIMYHVHEAIKPHCSISERRRGYEAALAESGLERLEVYKPTEDAVNCILHGDTGRPTAIVAYSDYEATLLVHAMWQYGIAIPGEISIVGFNNLFATEFMTPPLTTVGFDASRIGEKGAEMVVKEIELPLEERTIQVLELKPRLVVRGSTAPPPGK